MNQMYAKNGEVAFGGGVTVFYLKFYFGTMIKVILRFDIKNNLKLKKDIRHTIHTLLNLK